MIVTVYPAAWVQIEFAFASRKKVVSQRNSGQAELVAMVTVARDDTALTFMYLLMK